MKKTTLLMSFLFFCGSSSAWSHEGWPSDSQGPFRFRLALRPASAPEVHTILKSAPDLETNQLLLMALTEDENFNGIDEDLALFTCAQPKDAFQWVIKRKEDEKMIGLAGFYGLDEKNARATLALYFEKEHRDESLMADAVNTIIEFAYAHIGLNRIDFYLYPDRIGFTDMSRLCNSFGFIKVGELPEQIYHAGCYRSFILYCLLQKNFKKSS